MNKYRVVNREFEWPSESNIFYGIGSLVELTEEQAEKYIGDCLEPLIEGFNDKNKLMPEDDSNI